MKRLKIIVFALAILAFAGCSDQKAENKPHQTKPADQDQLIQMAEGLIKNWEQKNSQTNHSTPAKSTK